jgi:hypothetical protein
MLVVGNQTGILSLLGRCDIYLAVLQSVNMLT